MWDVNIIETAMKDFYNNDLDAMTQAIQMNITVSVVAVATIVVSVKSDLARLSCIT